MFHLSLRAAVGVTAVTIALQGFAAAEPTIGQSLAVRGNVKLELNLSIKDLKEFPVQRLEDARVVREAGSRSTEPEIARRYTGCLLRDVLDRAKPIEKNRYDLRKSIVVVTAADGYRAVFSWAELYVSPIGDGVLVVYERDGRPLPDSEGPLALVSLNDTRPGPRHVKWLRSIEVRLVSD
ncbi:MAG TPA: molybdopterin-dependent oxidoreductase [Casimicrobiaceae bacterium]|nr:molybdopterin-dependent oxidoreductase [Casimicrobiaceae bacterium]